MRSYSIVDAIYGSAILATFVIVVGTFTIRFFWPHAEGVSWWLLFASMPGAMFLLYIAAAFGLEYLKSRNNDVQPLSDKNYFPTREEVLFRRIIGVLIVYWCATLVSGIIVESQAAAQAAIPRYWQPARDIRLTTTFTTNGLEYTLSTSRPHSRTLIDIRDSSNKIIGTFGVHNPEGKSEMSGTAQLPRHVQLLAATADVTLVPNYAITQCRDGWFSKSSGGGTCSHHGGEWRSMYQYFR